MNLSELIVKLQELEQKGYGDKAIAMMVQRPHSSIGPSAKVLATGVSPGFDWDMGSVFIHAGETLYTGLDKMQRASRTIEDIHCWLNLRSEKMTTDEKLKLVNDKIARYHDKTKEI